MRRTRERLRNPLLMLVEVAGSVSSDGPARVIAHRHLVRVHNRQLDYAPLILVARRTPFGMPLTEYERVWRDTFHQ